MDIIERIKELRDERGWSTNRLALEAELTQSTVAALLAQKTNSLPSLDTLTHLCDAFGMTLAQFFLEEEQSELVSNKIRRGEGSPHRGVLYCQGFTSKFLRRWFR